VSFLVWNLEWRTALRKRRAVVLNFAIPLLLVAPIAFSTAPIGHAAAVYAVLFTMFGTFGAAIPLVRDAETGILQRIGLTGFDPRRLLVERIIAQAALDWFQLLPAIGLILAVGRPSAPLALTLPLVLGAILLCANAIGSWIAAIAGSIAEAALLAAVSCLFALHAAGVFRAPLPGSIGHSIQPLVPFRYLHQALLPAVGAPPPLSPLLLLGGATAGAVFCLGLSAFIAPRLMARLARITSV